eukprot:5022402-Karenia_brevis.AAC.1
MSSASVRPSGVESVGVYGSQSMATLPAGAISSPVLFGHAQCEPLPQPTHASPSQKRVVAKRFATAGHASPASSSVLFDATIEEESTAQLKDFKIQDPGHS